MGLVLFGGCAGFIAHIGLHLFLTKHQDAGDAKVF